MSTIKLSSIDKFFVKGGGDSGNRGGSQWN